MKKISFLFCALMLCLSARANYYVVGDFNGWDVSNAVELTTTDGENYTVQLDTLRGGFKIISARDWDHSVFGASSSSVKLSVGETISIFLEEGDSYSNINVAGAYVNAVLSFSITNNTAQLTLVSGTSTYYIVGDFNNWDVSTAIEMTTTDGVHYYVHLDTLYGGFKITNARDWNHIDWGAPRSDNSFGYSKHNWYDYVYGALKSNENWESDPNYNILTDQAYSNVTIGFYINNNNQRYIWYDKVTLAGMKVYDNEILYQITNVSPAQVKIIGNYISSPTDLVIPDSVNYNGTDFAVTAIGDQAFQGNDYLTSVTIPESVTTIGYEAFEGCTGLTSVTIPESVTTIGEWAFEGCTGLTSVTIPESVTTIGNGAFNGCTGLTAVTWNAKLCRTVTHSPFPSSVQTFTFGSQVERIPAGLCRNLNQLSTISLPQSLMQIDNYAFMNTGLTSIVIPENLDTIGDCVFWRCNNLSSVNWKAKNCKYTRNGHYSEEGEHAYGELFPNSVQSFVFDNQVERIDAYLCYNLNQVSIVNLPNSLIYIGSSAFEGTGLNSIVVPENVDTIGRNAFEGCNNLSLVIWNARNCTNGYWYNTYVRDDNDNYIYEWTNSSNSPFPSSVGTFIFGDYVQQVPSGLCSGLNQLTSIALPNTVRTIGNSAFSGCSGLISFTMENGVQTIGNRAFSSCSNLPQIVMPNTVTKIGTFAFEDCSNLTTVTIGNSVDTIDNYAFGYCNRLISIELPATVTYIGERAFDGCSAMNKAIVHSTTQLNSNSCLMYNAQLDTVIVPASLFDINETDWVRTTKKMKYLLINSGELTENGLAVIRRSASTLETLDVAATTNTTMADEAFSNMYNLTTLALPQNLERISYMAAAGCKMLPSIVIPASVTEIGTSAFENCRSLQAVIFSGNNLQTIGNWAFYNNHALRQITIPAGVTTIGAGAFYGCTYLEDLAMPASLRNVGDNAFALCNHLTKMQVEATLPPQVAARTFFDVNRAIPVYVPDEAVNDYRTTQVWQEFFIRPISQMATGIGEVEQDGQEGTGMLPDGKFMQNGQLFIRKNGRVYDTQGRLIE